MTIAALPPNALPTEPRACADMSAATRIKITAAMKDLVIPMTPCAPGSPRSGEPDQRSAQHRHELIAVPTT